MKIMDTPKCQNCGCNLFTPVETAYTICRSCYQELKSDSLFNLENADLTPDELEQAQARHNELYENGDWS